MQPHFDRLVESLLIENIFGIFFDNKDKDNIKKVNIYPIIYTAIIAGALDYNNNDFAKGLKLPRNIIFKEAVKRVLTTNTEYVDWALNSLYPEIKNDIRISIKRWFLVHRYEITPESVINYKNLKDQGLSDTDTLEGSKLLDI